MSVDFALGLALGAFLALIAIAIGWGFGRG